MTTFDSVTLRFFDRILLAWPRVVLVCLFLLISFLGIQAKDFRLDASFDSLILEGDKDLHNLRTVEKRYGQQDFVIVTYTPKEDLLSEKTLSNIKSLRDELKALNGISSVVSILDVPLLESPPIPIKELASTLITLESPEVDTELARIELKNSPIYQNLLISPDIKTTALQIVFPNNPDEEMLRERRSTFREKEGKTGLSHAEREEYKTLKAIIRKNNDERRRIRHQNIAAIRTTLNRYRGEADLFLGGISMVTDDLITFIKNDLKLFGVGVLFFLIITLKIIFRQIRWILIPLVCCFCASLSMVGFLGLFGWEVTVISSNFISLQLIITMAVTIHLIVRYRELVEEHPEMDHRQIILNTVMLMLKPCLYAALTTIAGFASLILCDILPVINFGWMMISGITVSLILTFILFPTLLILIGKSPPESRKKTVFPFTSILAGFTERRGGLIIMISLIALIVSLAGIMRLVVENSFIDYFKQSTEIYRGMKVIDQQLGGTTPLDVIIDLDTSQEVLPPENETIVLSEDDEFGEFDEFNGDEEDDTYWFTSDKMSLVKKIDAYLDEIPETGKILSFGTMLKLAEKMNDGEPLDNFQLALLYKELPEEFRGIVLTPYISVEHDQARFSVRIRDSDKTLKRDDLLKKIRYDLTHNFGLNEDQVHLTGMLVLYNNMLQSLFNSQIKTLGVAVSALILMFLLLFRSLKLSLIAITPNILSIGIVLGVMGWMNIPLDMMTITIAAISVGIAVDDTIHYIHRFIHEFNKDPNYIRTLHRCHESIGQGMYYTSVTIIIGFSILTFSNFIPSIYFGLLTGLAMLIALIAAMTLLPQLLIFFKPLGPERGHS